MLWGDLRLIAFNFHFYVRHLEGINLEGISGQSMGKTSGKNNPFTKFAQVQLPELKYFQNLFKKKYHKIVFSRINFTYPVNFYGLRFRNVLSAF